MVAVDYLVNKAHFIDYVNFIKYVFMQSSLAMLLKSKLTYADLSQERVHKIFHMV
jgi:hypothetical protein